MKHLAIVMPAYNEADGLPEFLAEIREHTNELAETVSIVVVNDVSTDATAEVLAELSASDPHLHATTAAVNRGHGPTALAAYRAGLALKPDVIVHVDGDGQFVGPDFVRIVRAIESTDADVVHGVRQGRTDPWFRQTLTGMVRGVVAVTAHKSIPDVNTPLRAYKPEVLETLLAAVPDDALVPHVHFSLAEARRGFDVRYLRVLSIPRRGDTESGTMWGESKKEPKLPPKRLREFTADAAKELWTVSLKPGRTNGPA